MQSGALQPAYLLHSRPFRDSSLLLDFLTREQGRLSAIGRGVRSGKAGNKALLQPFTPLQASFVGRGELKTLRQVELLAPPPLLRGERLFSAMYMNELVVRLVQGQEADPSLFDTYQAGLGRLAGDAGVEAVLRRFELDLLDALGYALALDYEAESGEPVRAGLEYSFRPDQGFTRVLGGSGARVPLYPGAVLLRLAAGELDDAETLRHAKRLLRSALEALLGDKPLSSRRLFVAAYTRRNNPGKI